MALGIDSVVRILDVRSRGEIHAFRHGDFRVDSNYSSCAISPDGGLSFGVFVLECWIVFGKCSPRVF